MPAPESRQEKAGPKVTRRRVLVSLLAFGAMLLVAARLLRWRLRGPARRLLCLDPDRRTGTGTLTPEETETLVALGEVLVPSASAAEAFRNGPERVVTRTVEQLAGGAPGYHAEFVEAVTLLDRASLGEFDVPFAKADLPRRRRLVHSLVDPYVERTELVRTALLFHPGRRPVGRLWNFVARPILVGFYDSHLGWRAIGYSREPGECSNLVDYIHPPAV